MKFNKEYTKSIVEENFPQDTRYYVGLEVLSYPEGFDCFFQRSWDELTEAEQEERRDLIVGLFE